MDEYKDGWAIKEEQKLRPSHYYTGYETEEDAEEELRSMDRKPGAAYSVVYGREYFNRAMDEHGNWTLSTFAEGTYKGPRK